MKSFVYKQIQTPIILFKATELLPEYNMMEAKDNHWSQYTTSLSTVPIPGDHNTMIQEPHVSILAQKMSLYL
jgi:thioesterase domain-containing protein